MPDFHFQGSIQDGLLIVPKPDLLAICVEYRRPNMFSVTEEGSSAQYLVLAPLSWGGVRIHKLICGGRVMDFALGMALTSRLYPIALNRTKSKSNSPCISRASVSFDNGRNRVNI